MIVNGVKVCCNCGEELEVDYSFCSYDCEQEYVKEKKYASRYEGYELTPDMFYRKYHR